MTEPAGVAEKDTWLGRLAKVFAEGSITITGRGRWTLVDFDRLSLNHPTKEVKIGR